jgi:hypothetical protein
MSQVENPNITSPSRRAFLARTAPVAAAFVLAGGATAGRPIVPRSRSTAR